MTLNHRSAVLARWAARLLGTPLAVMVFLDFASDATRPPGFHAIDLFRLAAVEHFLLDVVLLACLGLLLAWRYESAGGWMAAAGGLVFAIACLIVPGLRTVWGLGVALTIPGCLYLAAAHEAAAGPHTTFASTP
jgi:hypothetical protein